MYNEIFEPIVLTDVNVDNENEFSSRIDMMDLPADVRKKLGIAPKDYDAIVYVYGEFDMTLEDEGMSPSILVIEKNFVVSYGHVSVLMSFTQFNMGELERDLISGYDWQHEWTRRMEAALDDAAERAWED